jgi:hypothetical protein
MGDCSTGAAVAGAAVAGAAVTGAAVTGAAVAGAAVVAEGPQALRTSTRASNKVNGTNNLVFMGNSSPFIESRQAAGWMVFAAYSNTSIGNNKRGLV